MHQHIIEAIKAIIAGKLDDAKCLLDRIINHSEDLQSNLAIAYYLSSYIAYLEQNEAKSSGYYNLIGSQYLDELSSFAFFIQSKKPAPSNLTPPLFSPKANGAIVIKGHSTEHIVSSLSKSPVIQPTIENRPAVPLIYEPIEQFKKCDDFWNFVLNRYLLKIGVPKAAEKENQLSCDNVIITAKNCAIPLFFLCQNLKSLSSFWGENSDLELSKPVTPSLLPKTPEIKFEIAKLTTYKPPATTGSLKQLLSTSNGNSTPSPLAERITPTPSMTSNLSTSGSSTSSNQLLSQKAEKVRVDATKIIHPAIPSGRSDHIQQRNTVIPNLLESHANKQNEKASLIPRRTESAPVVTDTYIAPNVLNDEDDVLDFFRLDNRVTQPPHQKQNDGQTDKSPHPIVIPQPTANTKAPQLAEQFLSQHNMVNSPSIKPAAIASLNKNDAITKNPSNNEQEKANLRDNNVTPSKANLGDITVSSSKEEKLSKDKARLRRCVTHNNCLATILWYLTGIRDVQISAVKSDEVSTGRTAIEIAANYGYIHCLSLMINATNDSHYFGRALKQAIIFEHHNCIQLLLSHPINFNELAEIYYLLKNKNNEKFYQYIEYLLSNTINLLSALVHNHKDLIYELAHGTGKESSDEKKIIVLKASELGYDCCLTEYMLTGIDQTTLEFAITNAIKINNDICFKIFTKQALTASTRIAVLFSIIQYLTTYYIKVQPNQLLDLINKDNSFKLALSILSDQDKEIAFLSASETPNRLLHLRLLLQNANISKETKTKALFNLCTLRDLDCILILLNKGIPRDKEKEAVQLISKSAMQLPHLISHAYKNHYLLTLLHDLKLLPKSNSLLAVLTRHREIASLNFLLDNGYNINLMHSEMAGDICRCYGTAFMIAAYYGDCETLAELLLDRQNNSTKPNLSLQLPEKCHFYYQIESTTPNGQQSSSLLQKSQQTNKIVNKLNTHFSGYAALHFAALHNSTACLRLLLEKIPINSEVLNLTNSIEETALHIAAKNNRFLSVKLLLKHRANINICNESGDNPLLSAIRHGHYQTVLAFAENPTMYTENLTSKLSAIDAKAALQNNIEAQISVITCLLCANINWPNKSIVDEKKAREFQNRLVTLFTLIVDQKNEYVLPMIINCLFSDSLCWPNDIHLNSEIFMACMTKLIISDNVDGMNLMKDYFSEFIEFSNNIDKFQGDLLEILSPAMRAVHNSGNFIKLLRKAFNPFKIHWECAKILLLAVSNENEKNQVAELEKDDDIVRKLLEMKGLSTLLIESPASIKLLKPSH